MSSCGFHPLYGDHSGSGSATKATPQMSQIHIDTIADRQGQKLRNDLIDIMQPHGEAPGPLYHLTTVYNETEVNLGLTNDAVTTRGQLTLSVSYRLSSLKDGKAVSSGSLQTITAYNIQTSEFATILSRDDAEERALRQIAENIALRLGVYFDRRDADTGKSGDAPPAAPSTGASGSGGVP